MKGKYSEQEERELEAWDRERRLQKIAQEKYESEHPWRCFFFGIFDMFLTPLAIILAAAVIIIIIVLLGG